MQTMQRTTAAIESLRFTLKEVAEIVGVTGGLLRAWVRARVLRPVRHGHIGPGGSHLFDARQLFGIDMAAWTWSTCYNRRWDYVAETVREIQGWSWPALEDYLLIRTDAWTEEALAKEMPKLEQEFPLVPGDIPHLLGRIKRSIKISRVIKERLGPAAGVDPGPGRMTETPKGTKGKRS
jgi:hypothetical protein